MTLSLTPILFFGPFELWLISSGERYVESNIVFNQLNKSLQNHIQS